MIFCAFFAAAQPDAPDAADGALSADELYEEGLTARYNRYWDRVFELWSKGEAQFPDDPRFSEGLGDVYAGRELYRLAKESYLKAEKIKPGNGELLFKLAGACGSLNEDAQAAHYLERLLADDPDNREGAALLGWMYYKLHRFSEGKALVGEALERLGYTPDLLMMLATINSDLLDYTGSRDAYEKAIALSARSGDTGFSAIANYNYSILESRFYRFDRARELASLSLELAGRASGHLALGELLLRRLDWKAGLAEYEAAFGLDRSPLSKLSLADAYRACGRLEEARSYAEDCLKRSNHAWMFNYGIDLNQYKRDIHEILYKAYSGIYHTENFTPASNPAGALRSAWKKISSRAKESYHKKLFYKYALLSGNKFSNGGADGRALPDTLMQYYYAFGAYPSRAVSYAAAARETEMPKIPASDASYAFYEGKLKKNKALLLAALAKLDPFWEKDLLADTLVELCAIVRPHSEYAESLYLANPGALRQNGIRLPVHIEVEGKGAGVLKRNLKRSGLKDEGKNKASRFVLRVRIDNDFVYYELFDTARGFALVRDTVLREGDARRAAGAAQAMARRIFTPF